jgi:hypothetical protein
LEIGDVLDYGPMSFRLKDSDALSDEVVAAVVAGVTENRTKRVNSVRVEMHDKIAALALLGNHFGLFTEKVQHDPDSTLAEIMKNAAIYGKQRGNNGQEQGRFRSQA